MSNIPYLAKQLELHSIIANEAQLQQLEHYIELLQKWNRVYNLIANDKTQHIIDRHILDSLMVLPYIHGKRIIDVGTGAGLPGIPLAIMLPDAHFALLDGNGKKTRFVTQAKISLQLNNIEVINERVELYQPTPLFDVVISRAFANINQMLTLTQHLCAASGHFVALKGDEVQQELTEFPTGFKSQIVERLPFKDKSINRHIAVISRS
jgi:16S rRNA (guanine527-N7)-methyltransferase